MSTIKIPNSLIRHRNWPSNINPLKAKLNPICHLLALLGAHYIFHVRALRFNLHLCRPQTYYPQICNINHRPMSTINIPNPLIRHMNWPSNINPLNAKLNLICHLLALLGTHYIFHVSTLRVNLHLCRPQIYYPKTAILNLWRLTTYIWVVPHRWPPKVAFYIFIKKM